MADKAVIDAVEAHLAANWSASPIVGANTTGEAPSDGSAFILVQYPVANSEQLTIGAPGANVWREEGIVRIVVNGPRGEGLSGIADWASTLAGLFRGRLIDGVQFWGPGSPAVDDRNDDGNYFRASIAIPYQYDLIG